jgi:Flp pilus assembly protein TadG
MMTDPCGAAMSKATGEGGAEPIRAMRRLLGDRSGIAAVEFALLLPVMVGLVVGGIEISDAFTVKRKVDNASSALGDLVARTEGITEAEMENIFDAAEAMIVPYSADNLQIKISAVSINDESEATVVWGVARHATPDAEDAEVTLPAGVTIADTFLIVADVRYTYKPTLGYALTGDIHLGDTVYLRPRLSESICYDDGCDDD